MEGPRLQVRLAQGVRRDSPDRPEVRARCGLGSAQERTGTGRDMTLEETIISLIKKYPAITCRLLVYKLGRPDTISTYLPKLVKAGKILRIKGPLGFSYFISL